MIPSDIPDHKYTEIFKALFVFILIIQLIKLKRNITVLYVLYKINEKLFSLVKMPSVHGQAVLETRALWRVGSLFLFQMTLPTIITDCWNVKLDLKQLGFYVPALPSVSGTRFFKLNVNLLFLKRGLWTTEQWFSSYSPVPR